MMKKSCRCSVCYDTQMSDGERLLLEKLRKGPLKDLSEEQYAIIQKETDANGIRGLKGSTAQLVYNAIRKYDKEVKKANPGTVTKYNIHHDDVGRFASGIEGTGIGTNGDDNMAAMDANELRPVRQKRKLTATERTLLNRITDPAGNMILRPGDNPGVYNTPFSVPHPSSGGVTGYVPFSGVTAQPGAGGM